jgi:hypothetical protein
MAADGVSSNKSAVRGQYYAFLSDGHSGLEHAPDAGYPVDSRKIRYVDFLVMSIGI